MTNVVEISEKALEAREAIHRLESAMLEMPQVEIKTTHHFSDGIYAREIFIPEGVTLTGKIHKTEHLNILALGTITVSTDEGSKTLTAPCTMVCPPNTKRAGYAHTDCVWITIHGTKERDLLKLEQELITEEYLKLDKAEVNLCHG